MTARPLILTALLLATALAAAADVERALCSVCRVHEGETEAEEVKARAEHDGQTYGFCSTDCRDAFLEHPAAYLPPVFPRPAPPFEVRALDGSSYSSEALEGRVVLLDFWATWCQPCLDDLPRLSALHRRHADAGFSVVSVSIDEGKKAARKVTKAIERRKADHPIYLDAAEDPAWTDYLVRVVPAQFLIDQDGRIVAQWSGKVDLEVVEAEVVKLLGGG